MSITAQILHVSRSAGIAEAAQQRFSEIAIPFFPRLPRDPLTHDEDERVRHFVPNRSHIAWLNDTTSNNDLEFPAQSCGYSEVVLRGIYRRLAVVVFVNSQVPIQILDELPADVRFRTQADASPGR